MFSTEINYEVITFSIGDTKAGTKMGKLQLKDTINEEVLNCILWEEALNRMDSKLFRTGNILRIVSGSFNEKFNNCLVNSLELIKEAKTGLEASERENVYKELEIYINKISDEKLRDFVANKREEVFSAMNLELTELLAKNETKNEDNSSTEENTSNEESTSEPAVIPLL